MQIKRTLAIAAPGAEVHLALIESALRQVLLQCSLRLIAGFEGHTESTVVLQIFSNPRQGECDRNVESFQVLSRADARAQQDRGRAKGSGAKHKFSCAE